MFELVKKITEIPGPSGFETPVADFVAEEWARAGANVVRTATGNVIAHLGGNGPRLLIDAHLDEISILVKSVTESGFLMVTHGQGGSEVDRAPNLAYYLQKVLVLGKNGYVPGVLGTTTGHVKNARLRRKAEVEWDDIFVDIGATSKAEVLALGIRPGRPVIFDAETRQLGHFIEGKAMDTRANLAQMVKFAREYDATRSAYDVYLAATIQEEIGLIGASAVGNNKFDLAIALEVGLAGDIPTVGLHQMPSSLGQGPLLVHKDVGVHYDERVLDALECAAQEIGVPVQHVVFYGFGSDGSALIKQGIPTGLFCFPCRYTHSSHEMCSLDDLDAMVKIMLQFCRAPRM